VRFLTRLLFPWLLKTFVRKVEKRVNDQMNQQGNNGFEREGDVFIKRPQDQKPNKKYEGGEYVDFEEIEE
jgi:hypothetical protein